MQDLLRRLLNQLDRIGVVHEEVYDSECREQMGNAIFHGFVKPKPDFALPDDFGLFSEEGNRAVKVALAEYILDASVTAAFQNEDVQSDVARTFYDSYFGWANPDLFDSNGNVIDKQ